MSEDGRNLVEFLEDQLPEAVHRAIAKTLATASDLGFFAVPGPEMGAAWELGYRVLRRFVLEGVREEELTESVKCGDYDRASAVITELIADGSPMREHFRR